MTFSDASASASSGVRPVEHTGSLLQSSSLTATMVHFHHCSGVHEFVDVTTWSVVAAGGVHSLGFGDARRGSSDGGVDGGGVALVETVGSGGGNGRMAPFWRGWAPFRCLVVAAAVDLGGGNGSGVGYS